MPVQIGAPTHDFSDPTGLLSDCHRRIEMFLGALDAVARGIDRPLPDEAIQALDSALRYFRDAAPKHTSDEEESLFPRLRQVHHPDVESALTKLDSLELEHRQAAPLHDEIERLGRQCLSSGSLSPGEAETFRKAVTTLISMYKEHIGVEDGLVFPLAARLLSRADKAVIADEMATRRNVRLLTKITPFTDGD
jgi:hemerythrin-like domain-containing protein